MRDGSHLAYLAALAHRYPTVDAALAEIANLRAVLALPKATVHVVSDVHGEHKKLGHIIRNASGGLRPLVEDVFGIRLDDAEKSALLSLIYYARETWTHAGIDTIAATDRRAFVTSSISKMLEVLRALARQYTVKHVERVFPEPYKGLFRELLVAQDLQRTPAFLDALLDPFFERGRDLDVLRLLARVLRNLTVGELVVAGDLGDRGPRIDRVIDILIRQPAVSITWGNHDVSWMGACLGHAPLIATVLRVSIWYRRLAQLEEGYGIPVASIEKLARLLYENDPAERFTCKGEGLRDPLLMARMQKAMAVIQFKLEGQLIRNNPQWGLEHRALLHRMDLRAGTVELDGVKHPLRDTSFPTIDPDDPYTLHPEEAACMARLKASFMASPTLWRQMRFVAERGTMWLRRDRALIFHGCVPVDDAGEMLLLEVDGEPRTGRAMFEALERVVHRAIRAREPRDLDMLWYLWTGPLSPAFGKDRMATFETYLVADKATHHETKNPYFKLIHDRAFCMRMLREFGIDDAQGLIVNGHVPVKLEAGESPLKKSGAAVTIDGAFSEAYGDKGYTLILDATHTALALHHHFESVDEAVRTGSDIIPSVTELASSEVPRMVADTEKGDELRREIQALEELIRAYEDNIIPERDQQQPS